MNGISVRDHAVTPDREPQDPAGSTQQQYKPKHTPQQYLEAIAHHARFGSNETFFPGDIYETLRKFMESPESSAPPRSNTYPYATLFDLSLKQRATPDQADSQGFDEPDQCVQALRANIEASDPQILFLRGHPSPRWLKTIGAFCRVEPELWRWFIRYKNAAQGNDHYFGAAPSSMSHIVRFKFSTIGRSDCAESSNSVVERKREEASKKFKEYSKRLWTGSDLRRGDPIIRGFHVLDETHCVVEQEVSACVFEIAKTWMVIACTDTGVGLSEERPLPWARDGTGTHKCFRITALLPTVQVQARCALKFGSIFPATPASTNRRFHQSLTVLSAGYGTTLEHRLAREDRFYAFSEFFKLSAFSENQLLNVIDEKVSREFVCALSNDNPTLANLFYFRNILDSHIGYIDYMLRLIKHRDWILQSGTRSKAPDSQRIRAQTQQSARELETLFQKLFTQAQALRDKCSFGITLISNNSMLAESKRAIDQAELVTKLTFAAFIFLPFTFASGFFGMNFRELGTSKNSIWEFFVVSVPMFLASMAFYYWQRVSRLLKAFSIGRKAARKDDKP